MDNAVEMTPNELHALYLLGDSFPKWEDKREVVLKVLKNSTVNAMPMESITKEWVEKRFNDVIYPPEDNNLLTKYIVPPFSILMANSGPWQKRRALWEGWLGDSTVGRKEGLAYGVLKVRADDNGTSKFDALLCELVYKWFGFNGATVLDPFAGGITRGAIAHKLGLEYTGFDINLEQIEANRKRGKELDLYPNWLNEDAIDIPMYTLPEEFDLVFTCPPYGDLEKYTDDPRDLSNMSYAGFMTAYASIIDSAVRRLKPNRFAVWVVGDIRDEQGFYRGLVSDTIRVFSDSGVKLYNELILLNSVGTASMRATGSFRNRKMVKIHQNVLVFYKGDPDKIQETYGEIDTTLPLQTLRQTSLF